jgi:cytoskeleton protein RodZ
VVRDNDSGAAAGGAPIASLGLGERLRSARKARALSVAQVGEAMRLEESIVVALEEERFEAIGAPVFVRGHLRRYAQLVGLSEDVILEAYRRTAPESDRLPSLARRREQAETMRVATWVYWAAAALVLIGVVLSLATDGNRETAAPPADALVPPPATPSEPTQ